MHEIRDLREFNKLWAGQTVSLLGTQLTLFALPTLAVLGLHASALQIGVRFIVAATGTSNLGAGMNGAVSLFFAYRVLHLAPSSLGIVSGLAQLGFLGALLSTPIRRRFGLRLTLLWTLLLCGIGQAVELLAQREFPLAFVFISLTIVAIAVPIYNINQVSYRQALVDVRKQGRLNATVRTFVWGTLPIGAMAGGVLASRFGPQTAIAIGAVVSAAAAIWIVPFDEHVEPQTSVG